MGESEHALEYKETCDIKQNMCFEVVPTERRRIEWLRVRPRGDAGTILQQFGSESCQPRWHNKGTTRAHLMGGSAPRMSENAHT
eukprot:1026439-Pelagomonas_calceolata.AAC.1